MFALVKYKCDNSMDVVPVENICIVRKINGLKHFIPFEPISDSDFVVSKKYKYVVHRKDVDGTIRCWYAMIGRLGVSIEDISDESNKEPILWPTPVQKKPIYHPYERTHMKDIHAGDTGTCPTKIISAMNDTSNQENQLADEACRELNSPEQTLQQKVDSMAQRITELEENIEKTKQYYKSNSDAISALVPVFVNTLKDSMDKVFTSVERSQDTMTAFFEKHVTELKGLVNIVMDNIKKGANLQHVYDWVNSIPVNLPGLEEEGGNVTLNKEEDNIALDEEEAGETLMEDEVEKDEKDVLIWWRDQEAENAKYQIKNEANEELNPTINNTSKMEENKFDQKDSKCKSMQDSSKGTSGVVSDNQDSP